MARFIAQRLVQTIPVLIFMSILVFSLMFLLPGDPVLGLVGPGMDIDDAAIEQMREDLNLNDPIPMQYLTWAGNILQGDFGRSVASNQPVAEAIVERLPVTAFLALFSMVIMVVIALPLGVLSAVKRGTKWDLFASVISVIGLAVPGFWLAMLMVLLFGVNLGWLPASGYVSPIDNPIESIRHLMLPAIALGVTGGASLTRQLRSSLLEVLQEDYIRTSRAKGLHPRGVLFRHALRNALIPSVTVLGMSLGALFGGSLIIESIFLVPGIGSLLVNAIFTRDFPVVQAGTLVIAVLVVFINLGVDLIYGLLDPRIK